LDIDKLLIIPTFLNPFKDSFAASASLRLSWMQKLTQNEAKIEVLDIETSKNHASPTYETLQELKLRYNFTQKPYLIIGADNVKNLHRWNNYENLAKEVNFVVANRETYEDKHPFLKLDVNYPVSSTDLRQHPDKKYLPQTIADEIISFYKENNDTSI
jgi:nicotinate-nucleotide adenylyltransferase